MKKRYYSKIILLAGILLSVATFSLAASGRPNILFCLADDWGWPHAGAYGDHEVKTPSFDTIAKRGALFNHVYVSSPSCTPSRNAFITGKYHWQLGSGANLWSTLPVEHESFIHMLRDNGYVTGRNNRKTWGPGDISPWQEHHGAHPGTDEYRSIEEFLESTDAGEKPFFFWLGTSDPHRGYELDSGRESGIDISKVHMFDHYPDSETIRSDVADYYFEVQRWDTLVGETMAELEKRGLLDNTIVIMTGDHGMPFPRGKGNLYDSGVRVPFAVSWPDGMRGNRHIDDFLSFADIAPTLLELTGTPVPDVMSGASFAELIRSGKSGRLEPEKRPYMVFGKERHVPSQEKPNMGGYPCRGIRTTDFLYIRNYHPELWPMGTGDPAKANREGQWYADCDAGPTKDYIINNRDRDEIHQRAFELTFAKRPAEELYDVKKDPGQLNNVADDPEYREVLVRLRAQMQDRLSELDDPRARDPYYPGFDQHPYLGGFGGMKSKKK